MPRDASPVSCPTLTSAGPQDDVFRSLRQPLKAILLAGLLATLPVALSAADKHQENWSRFRGPNGAGRHRGSAVPVAWKEGEYQYRVKLPGVGHGSPIAWGDQLFLTSGEESTGKRIVSGHRRSDGQLIWRQEFSLSRHRKHALNSFASTTPAVDAHRVYCVFGSPESILLVALDHAGKELWRRDLGPFRSGHGWGASPIVHAGRVHLAIEHSGQSALLAIDAATGKTVWRHERDSKLHYATPCVHASPQGKALIFSNWSQGITAHDPDSGRQLWQANVFDKKHVESAIGSPIVAGDLVIGVCGWLGYGNEVIAVRPDGSGSAKVVYRIRRGAPLCTTPLAVDGFLFLWSDNGVVTCADLQTGKQHWRKRIGGVFYASPIAIGKRVYNVDTRGVVTVLAASAEYKVLGRSSVGEASHATPAVVGNSVYWRTFTHLVAVGPKQ